eukprot:scaffold16203_cov71-Skeletonema_dohrnii-CCMP3373.AAC.2
MAPSNLLFLRNAIFYIFWREGSSSIEPLRAGATILSLLSRSNSQQFSLPPVCNYLDSLRYQPIQYSIDWNAPSKSSRSPRSYHDRGGRLQFARHKNMEEPSLKRRAGCEA